VAGCFPQEKEAVAVEIGGQPCEVSWILILPLSRASPGAYRSYIEWIMCLVLLTYACVDCALRVGSCMIVIGCMLVPFRTLS
jgi:hypothetical protein